MKLTKNTEGIIILLDANKFLQLLLKCTKCVISEGELYIEKRQAVIII